MNAMDHILHANHMDEGRASNAVNSVDGKEMLEGDMVYTSGLKSRVAMMKLGIEPARDAISRGQWPDNTIPYVYAPGFRKSTLTS